MIFSAVPTIRFNSCNSFLFHVQLYPNNGSNWDSRMQICSPSYFVLLWFSASLVDLSPSRKTNQVDSLTRWNVKIWPLGNWTAWKVSLNENCHGVSLISYLQAAKPKRSHSRVNLCFQWGTRPHPMSSLLSNLPKAQQGRLTLLITSAIGLLLQRKKLYKRPDQGVAEVWLWWLGGWCVAGWWGNRGNRCMSWMKNEKT